MNNRHSATFLLTVPWLVAMLPVIATSTQRVSPTRAARPAVAAQHFNPVEWLVARAVDTSPEGDARGGRIDVLIERWSSNEEHEQLRRALAEGGPDKLLAALRQLKRPVGVVRFPGVQGLGARARSRRGENLLFAREIKTAAGRQVIVATDAHLALGEPNRNRRPRKREFTLIDIRLDSDRKGVGKVALASQVTYNARTTVLELAKYETQPLLLTEVRSAKR